MLNAGGHAPDWSKSQEFMNNKETKQPSFKKPFFVPWLLCC
jgi:hypothetical protein